MPDTNLPDGSPAPAPVNPQVPAPAPGATPPADPPAPQTNISFDSFSEDDKKYLAGQGITKQEELTSEALVKVINHARSSQKTAAEKQAELEKIRAVTNPQPAPNNPFAVPAPQPSTTQPSPTPGETPPAPAATPPQMDNLQMFTLANQLGGMFPELADDLTTGKFYQDMQAIGIPLTVNGQVNINGITTFGKTMQTQKQLEAKIADMNKPNENNQAPAEPQAPAPLAADAPMTQQIAQAIAFGVTQGNTHPRAKEAEAFLQANVGTKK